MNEINKVLNGQSDSHVMPFLWQKGESKEVIREYLEKIKESNIHEVVIESRPHPHFCEDSWWDDLGFIIDVAKSLDLKIWILDDKMFPTGRANGLIEKKYPQKKRKVLSLRVVDAYGPQVGAGFYTQNDFDYMKQELKIKPIFKVIAVSDEKRIDITEKIEGDKVYWDLPEGVWHICFIYIDEVEYKNEFINMVDKESCDVLIEAVYEPHFKHFKEEFGKTIKGFFTDEPGFVNERGNKNDSLIGKREMPLPWSSETEQGMKNRFGEDYATYLPSLWLDLNDSPKIRVVYMDIVTHLYRTCFDENIGNWCRERGVMHIGHIIEDRDSHARLGVGVGHYFRSLSGQDMSGIDIVLNQVAPGLGHTAYHDYGHGSWDLEFFHYALVRMGTSLGQIDPLKKGRTMAEVFGAFGWQEGIKSMKWIVDCFLVGGVNNYVPHAFSQAAFPDFDCPPHIYAGGNDPQFRFFGKLASYMNGMSTLFSEGKSIPSAAILYHAEAEWSGKAMFIQKPAKVLTQHQIDFHIIPNDVFNDEKYQTDTTQGLTVNGHAYKCLIIPYAQYISHNLQQFIKHSSSLGYPIYFIDGYPEAIYDSEDSFEPYQAKVVSLNNIASVMHENGYYDIRVKDKVPNLRFYHYIKDEDIYMFFNDDPKHEVHTEVEGLQGYRISLLDNSVVKFDGTLHLYPGESCLIVLEYSGTVENDKCFDGQIPISSDWIVSVSKAQEYPVFKGKKSLPSFEDLGRTLYPKTTGTFKYESTFVIDQDISEFMVSLDEVYELAEVFIDGNLIGTKISAPYHFYKDTLKKGNHTISIEVTNTLDKELQDFLSWNEVIKPSGLLTEPKLLYVNKTTKQPL